MKDVNVSPLFLSSAEYGHQTHAANLYSSNLQNTAACPTDDTRVFTPEQHKSDSHTSPSCKWTCWHLRGFFFHAKSYTQYYDAQTETMGNESCLRSEMSRDIPPVWNAAAWYMKTRRTQSHGRTDRCLSADGRTASFGVTFVCERMRIQWRPELTLALLIASKNWWVNKMWVSCQLAVKFIISCKMTWSRYSRRPALLHETWAIQWCF